MNKQQKIFNILAKEQKPMKVELAGEGLKLAQEGQKIFLDARTKASDKVSEAAEDWIPAQKKLYLLLQEAESSLKRIKAVEAEFNFETKLSAEFEKAVSELKDYFDKANKYESKFREASKFKL